MKASQLRDLTRKYAANGMSREEYLAERTRLIDGMVSGEIEIRYRELKTPPSVTHRHKDARQWRYAFGSICLLALLLLALAIYFLGDDAPHEPAVIDAPAGNPGEGLLSEFMQKSDWSEASLTELEARWAEISAFHQEGTRRSMVFRRLKNATGQRIREQEALVAAGEPEALLHVARLRNFARTLGIEEP